MERILFYKVGDEYGYFSNFSPFPIFIDGLTWPTVEHYFQASKFLDPSVKERIRLNRSPLYAAQEGRKNDNLRSDWEEVKVKIMKNGLKRKFLQHHVLKVDLLHTSDKLIIEHAINDEFWGDGRNGNGKNMLGILIMELRSEIKRISNHPEWVLPPWIPFPELEPEDMFWRMGFGESYMFTWAKWFNNAEPHVKKEYMNEFIANPKWQEFFN